MGGPRSDCAGGDGPKALMLRQMVEDQGLGARVELLGEVAAADVLPHSVAVHVISLRRTQCPPWQPVMRGCMRRQAHACQTALRLM